MINKNIVTLTIAIPAHNEEKNIANLLQDILNQKQVHYKLEKILVVADCCRDNTVKNVLALKNKKIQVIEFTKRRGKAEALDIITKESTTDALLLLDADVRLKNTSFIETLINPIVNNVASITSGKVIAEKSNNFVSYILAISNDYKHALYEGWNKGNNVYTCHGRAICLQKTLYKKMKYAGIIADDAAAYLESKRLGLKYKYVSSARVYYKLPKTIADHMKQSSRFMQSQKQLETIFSSDFIKKHYAIPMIVVLKKTLSYFMKKPVGMTLYIALFTYLKGANFLKTEQLTVWDIAHSSKK